MKIRTDFVTNSSSSTFYLSKEATLIFVDSDNRYSFKLFHEKGEGHSEKEESAPQDYGKFVNWRYLMTGTKPTLTKMVSGKGIKDYAQFLIDNKKEAGAFYFIIEETEYRIGYGESIGDDFDMCEKQIFSHLHPALSRYYSGKKLYSELFNSDVIDPKVSWIEKKRITGDPDGECRYYRVICDEIDFTEDFYYFLYQNASCPKLDFEEIKRSLSLGGFDAKTISRMQEQNMQIIYFGNKTKENDVIVYLTEDEELIVEPICRFLKQI